VKRLGSLALAVCLVCGCGAGLRRFPLAEPMWRDPDMHPFAPAPEGFYSSFSWDGADNAVFRPISEFFLFRPSRAAINVNALDEVPDSSWFTNRLSRRLMTPEEAAIGACDTLAYEPPGPWTIVGGKPDGANPGFQIEDAEGVRYLLKTDGDLQAERPGAADAIAALMHHAAGYYVPCNRVVVFDRSILALGEGVEIKRTSGAREPLTEEVVDRVLSKATRLADGRYRASVSQFIDGRPIGPFRYHGLMDDDPNDVVPHEHRRDLRGLYVMSSWTSHIDSRQENTMAAWIETDEETHAGYVRHYQLDMGDCFGIIHDWDELVKRFGHSGYLDGAHITADFLTLGLVDRPWYHAEYGDAGKTLGYFDAFRYEPDAWRPGYANNAYDQLQEGDAAWMTRIVARFRNPLIRAMVERGRFSDPVVESELIRILIERRDKILRRWLTRLSPLTWPDVRASEEGGAEVCLQDLATWSRIRSRGLRRYFASAWYGDRLEPLPLGEPRIADDSYVCVPLPEVPGAGREDPPYLVVDVVAASDGLETTHPARLHFIALGSETPDYRLVGLERPDSDAEPTP
jgi:hypothetical protein